MSNEEAAQKKPGYREALRIELHGQSKIFEHIPKRKAIQVKIMGPYMLDIKFVESPEKSAENVIYPSSSESTVKEMTYCGGFSIWWK